MNVNEIKDKVQRQALNTWFKNKCRGTLEMATGVGKSRCGVLAADYVCKNKQDAKILIITPTETIRDDAWQAEFEKWGCESLLESNVVRACIQTVYKWENKHFDLVIADEIHNYIPTVKNKDYQFFKFFENNKFDKILGLSASIATSLMPRLWSVAPVVYKVDVQKALELGLISPFVVYNLAVNLTAEERLRYEKADAVFNKLFQIFTNRRGHRDIRVLFSCLNPVHFKKFCIHEGYSPEEYAEMKYYPHRCHQALKARKDILYNAENKVHAIEELVNKLSDRRGIVFSQSIDFANEVYRELGSEISTAFHSKITKKNRKKRIDDFNDLETPTRIICSAMSLNEGANLNDVSLAIIASGTSKEKDFIQRLGRSVRLQEGKEAYMIRLYIPGTKDEDWMNSSQENYHGTMIDSINQIK